MIELNKIYNMDCIELLPKIPDNFIDLIITSPPYDDLREYEGYSFNFKLISKELYRIIKNGGIIVWIVGDQIINGSESGTSFNQALYFKELGFNLHDTMIYMKNGISFPDRHRYQQCFEYMFIFSKGNPKTINLISDRKNVSYGRKITGSARQKNGTTIKCQGNRNIKKFGIRWNIWQYNNTNINFTKTSNHPAPFPENLSNDHILSWSNKNDIIFDPFMGSGTTAISCLQLDRNFIGTEISKNYCNIANNRINNYKNQVRF